MSNQDRACLGSLEQWNQWINNGYTILPYIQIYSLDDGADRIPDWQEAWREADANSFVLESGKDGRYTFLGLSPVSVISGKGDHAIVKYGNDRSERSRWMLLNSGCLLIMPPMWRELRNSQAAVSVI